jgi:uncharacterized membrane protein
MLEGLFFAAAAIFLILVVPGLSIVAFNATRHLQREIELLRAELRLLRGEASAPSPAQRAPYVVPAPMQPPPAAEPDAPFAEPQPSAEGRPSEHWLQAFADAPTSSPLPPPEETNAPVEAAPIAASAAEPAPHGFEQRLGARGFVWLGGACVALAGAFLVKYSIDEGLLGPTTRIVFGILLGLALLVGADYMRRRSGTIGQALAAAGIADLYASLFAAVALYELLPPALAFVILAGVTFLAIALALRHGPFVGLVGLAGGFITPAIVSTGEPNPAVLFGYLYLLQLGALWLERQRGWWYLPAIAIAGGLCWALVVVTLPPEADGTRIGAYSAPIYLILIAGGVLWLKSSTRFGGLSPAEAESDAWTNSRIVAAATGGATALLMLLWLTAGGFRTLDWAFVLIFAAMGMAIGRFKPRHDLAGFAMAAVPLLGLLFWDLGHSGYVDLALSGGPVDRYLWTACIVGAFGIFGGFGLAWGAKAPERWSLLSAIYGAVVLALAYWRLRGIDLLLPWSIVCLILSGLHLAFAERLHHWRFKEPIYRRSFGVHALACAGFLAAAVPLWVGREWLAVLWSLMLPLTLWISIKIDEPWLRRSVWVGAPVVMLAVLSSGFPAGDRPLFNWLAYGLGVPTLCFAAAAWLARRASDLRLMLMLQGCTVILGFLLVTLEVRHLFHGAAFRYAEFGFTEAGTLILLWGLMALATWRLAEQRGEARLRWLAYGLAAAAALATAGLVWLIANPLLAPIPIIGTPIFNTALYVFGSGFALFLAMANVLRRSKLDLPNRQVPVALAVIIALIDGFLGISALNRHLFRGEMIQFNLFSDAIGNGELYGYSVAWLLYGVLIMILAVWRQLAPLRHAAAGIILLVVIKVFLVDASDLTGLYRVASFLGLGLTLMALGYLYQRFVLKRQGQTATSRSIGGL